MPSVKIIGNLFLIKGKKSIKKGQIKINHCLETIYPCHYMENPHIKINANGYLSYLSRKKLKIKLRE